MSLKYEPASEPLHIDQDKLKAAPLIKAEHTMQRTT